MSVAPADNSNETFMASMDSSGKMPWPFSKLPTTERGEQGEAKIGHGFYVFFYALLIIPLASPVIGFLATVRGVQNASKVEDDLLLKITRIFMAMGYGIFIMVYTLIVELIKKLATGVLEIFEACVTQ